MTALSGPGLGAETEDLLKLRHLVQARRARGGKLTGMPGGFVSRRRGRGLESDEIRAYAEGDDIRHLDKNATARTGVPHVRGFRDERDRTVLLAADFRAAMRWGTRRALRSVAAAEALALAGWAAVEGGARVGLLAAGPLEPVHVRPRGRSRAMVAICGALAEAHRAAFANGETPALDATLELAGALTPSGAAIILATGLDEPGAGFDLHASRLARRGRLCVLLIRDAFETKPPPGRYPFVVEDGAIGLAAVAPDAARADGRIARLRRLGAEVYPIDAGLGPGAMEVPGD